MRSCAVALSCCLITLAVPLSAQSQWVPPQAPCDISPGFYRLNSVPVNLKIAAEKPTQRDHLLSQTLDVITRSIREDHQEKNPAAWYYLGRYYVERADPAGADTAFTKAVTLAPQCAKDIAGYRNGLYAGLLADGQRTWQEGKLDSAPAFLRLAVRLAPDNPRTYFVMGAVFTSLDQLDSATKWLKDAVRAAGNDTAFAAAKRDALSTVARAELRHVQSDPAVGRWARTRFSRDSLARAVARDSSTLGQLQANAASRRARGARLSPADQRAFSAESTARAQASEQEQAARAALAPRVAQDSAAVVKAFAPAVAAYQDYVTAFPADAEAATTLAALYSQSARPGEAGTVFDAYFAHAGEVDPGALFDLGQKLVTGGLVSTGEKAYLLGLDKEPWNRTALFELATAYVGQRDSAHVGAVVQRLVSVDPQNRASLHLAAAAWDLRGRKDSARYYNSLADSGLAVDVTVGSFVPDATGYNLTAIATNLRNTPSKPLRLTFEFLDARGAVQSTQSADVPALAPGTNNQLLVHVVGKGLVGWRYRSS